MRVEELELKVRHRVRRALNSRPYDHFLGIGVLSHPLAWGDNYGLSRLATNSRVPWSLFQ